MKSILSKQEREELKSLKNDLVNPVKRFVGEVYTDTVGDAKAFYSRQAKQAGQTVKQVHRRTEEQMQVFAQKREAQQRQRKASLKWVAITLVLILAIGVIFISVALSARAEGADDLRFGEACLNRTPPDDEQTIPVCCRSGRRSIEAAAKLTRPGYANVMEFGGILDWDGGDRADGGPDALICLRRERSKQP